MIRFRRRKKPGMQKAWKPFMVMVFLVLALSAAACQPALAMSEEEVQAAVEASGKESVSGNVLVWFLCAIAFLKVSQKADSILASLGIHVGHSGGSMIAELMVAARGLGTARNYMGSRAAFGHGGTGGHGGGTGAGSRGDTGGFLAGGLTGVASRQVKKGAARAATAPAAPTSGVPGGTPGGKGSPAGGVPGMVGSQIYKSSVSKGGGFANGVISSVAMGSIATDGTMTGEKAAKALQSYMGYAALGGGAGNVPAFSNVEIGGGRITGTETSAAHPEGAAFGMYCTDRYVAPEGAYDTVYTADGAGWYRQYAVDTVEKSPYMAPDGSIAYNESLVKKLPPVPKRKDRL